MPEEFRYKAFISYCHADEKWAKWLHRALETYRVPRHLVDKYDLPSNRLIPIFRDRDELSSSVDLSATIEDALIASANLVVICSPEAAESQWVNAEIKQFKQLGKAGRVFCFLVGNPEESFPAAALVDVDGDGYATAEETEPLAADARLDGKADATLKIVAGLLGIGLDELKQRENRRRHQRLAYVAAGAIAGMTLTTGLAIFAMLAEREAVNARALAESHRAQANDLVSFMIGDLRTRLEEMGRLDVLDAVGQKALLFFASLQTAEITAKEKFLNAVSMRQIGLVRQAQGNLDGAIEAYQMSANALLSLRNEFPSNNNYTFEHAQSIFYIGYVHDERGELAESEEKLLEYEQTSSMLAAREPENSGYAMEVAYANANLAVVALRAGNYPAAQDYMLKGIVQTEQLATDFPEELLYKRELAESFSWVGRLETQRGNPREALRWQAKGLDLLRDLDEQEDSYASRSRVATHLEVYGSIQMALGEHNNALGTFAESRDLVRGLVERDEKNSNWRGLQYRIELDTGNVLWRSGGRADAVEYYRRAADGFAELVVLGLNPERAKIQATEARLKLARASANFGLAVDELDTLKLTTNSLHVFVDAHLLAGDSYVQRNQPAVAERHWNLALNGLNDFGSGASYGWINRKRAQFYHRFGEHAKEQQVLADLDSRGYWFEESTPH